MLQCYTLAKTIHSKWQKKPIIHIIVLLFLLCHKLYSSRQCFWSFGQCFAFLCTAQMQVENINATQTNNNYKCKHKRTMNLTSQDKTSNLYLKEGLLSCGCGLGMKSNRPENFLRCKLCCRLVPITHLHTITTLLETYLKKDAKQNKESLSGTCFNWKMNKGS